jgi:DNA-binding NtrC family response regulator
MVDGDVINAADLHLPGVIALGGSEVVAAAASPSDLDGLERETILRVLDETGGRRQRAAERLGISRLTLSRKLKVFGVNDSMADAATVSDAN